MKSIYRTYSDLELSALLPTDDQAFAEVYDRYFGIIYLFLRKMVQDEDLAEDMTQEIFLALYENRTSSDIRSLRAYLYQSARYALIMNPIKTSFLLTSICMTMLMYGKIV
jgi:RNA polymerase sigma-70 factor (ECF subfamily)